jgi:hypothetical protein
MFGFLLQIIIKLPLAKEITTMKLVNALLGMGLGLSLLMGTAMAADDTATTSSTTSVTAQARGVTVLGEVTKVDGDSVTVKTKDGSEKTIVISKNATFKLAKGGVGTLADVKVGVAVRATHVDAKNTTKSVVIAATLDQLNTKKSAATTDSSTTAKKKSKKAAATATPATN